ncbi:hypothetical protein M2H38_21075, partial [Vibrio vulnificus]|nr:hypothetical protein [Vibrio vulnificus]
FLEVIVEQEYIVSIISAVIAFISAIIALSGVYVSSRKNEFDKRVAMDKELFDSAIRKLESAYEMLTREGVSDSIAKSSRLVWISTARELEKYKAFKSRLQTEHYQMVLQSIEEYWSQKFYDVVGKNNFIHSSYYNGLEPGSVLIVYAFASWKEDQACPIDQVDYDQLLASAKIFQGRHGLKEFIQNSKQYSHLAQS